MKYGNQLIHVDFRELNGLINALDVIQARFGDRKVKQIASKAAQPLRVEMRNLAPQHKNNPARKGGKRGVKGKKYYWYSKKRYDYKSGTLKRSVGKWMGKTGVFVAPRIGKLRKSVAGKPNLDGWYAHLALAPHKVKGGETTRKHISPAFIEKARLRKRTQVLSTMLSLAKKEIKW
tara:strand:+ start:4217 stop:4744 length:528 start_codon:yes stop_codon:yes gene_type:complete